MIDDELLSRSENQLDWMSEAEYEISEESIFRLIRLGLERLDDMF
jgi:hypothetical protein